MAYCTPEELAQALRITLTFDNTERLTKCVDAAAEEIDVWHDRLVPGDIPAAPDSPALVNRDNVFRAVQWYKANDVALGGGGTPESGLLNAPTEPFTPMSTAYKQQWGVA